jgi:Flp pilus assembly pilin Flp
MDNLDISLRRAEETGASSVEYALLAVLIAVVILGSVKLLGGNLSASFQHSCESVAATTSGSC